MRYIAVYTLDGYVVSGRSCGVVWGVGVLSEESPSGDSSEKFLSGDSSGKGIVLGGKLICSRCNCMHWTDCFNIQSTEKLLNLNYEQH